MAIALLTHAWATAYPFVTGVTALCGMILAIHGVYRLIWRWRHGYSTLFDPREEPRRETDAD